MFKGHSSLLEEAEIFHLFPKISLNQNAIKRFELRMVDKNAAPISRWESKNYEPNSGSSKRPL